VRRPTKDIKSVRLDTGPILVSQVQILNSEYGLRNQSRLRRRRVDPSCVQYHVVFVKYVPAYSASARFLVLPVPIRPWAWMCVCCQR